MNLPVVDLFAGPGGLGEGFSAFHDPRVRFDVRLSVEMDSAACQTLLLRSFFRQFATGKAPEAYYQYLRGALTRDTLFERYPKEAKAARAHCLELEMSPSTTSQVFSHIERVLRKQDAWVLVGGPPCQAYSVVGRSRLTRLDREQFEKDERHVLYREYLRILARYRPPVFVMENVKGLLSAQYGGKSVFGRIMEDLTSPSTALRDPAITKVPRPEEYRIISLTSAYVGRDSLDPSEFIVKSEEYGVPQRRHRVILVGVRSDLPLPANLCLSPLPSVTVDGVLRDLPPLRSQLSRLKDDGRLWNKEIRKALGSLPRASLDAAVWRSMHKVLPHLRFDETTGGRAVSRRKAGKPSKRLSDWLLDPRMDFVCNHESRKHISADLLRYLFAGCFAHIHGNSPRLHEFPIPLLPNHKNVETAVLSKHGYFNDRFRVQIANSASTTITSHIAKDGHSFIHHDSSQCRSWTVREAARAQTFPDNYFFEGTRTDQYRQVGNAVPPYLATQIAYIVARILAPTLVA